MKHLGYVVILASSILAILVFSYYIFPNVICRSVLANGYKSEYEKSDLKAADDPLLQFCIAEVH